MFHTLVRVASAAALLITCSAHAQPAEKPLDCGKIEREGGTPYEKTVCRAQKVDPSDAALNKTYGQLREHFKKANDSEAEMLLVKAQRAWLTWRAAEGELCAQSRGWSRGGAGYDMVVQSCEADLTLERVTALLKHLHEAESH